MQSSLGEKLSESLPFLVGRASHTPQWCDRIERVGVAAAESVGVRSAWRLVLLQTWAAQRALGLECVEGPVGLAWVTAKGSFDREAVGRDVSVQKKNPKSAAIISSLCFDWLPPPAARRRPPFPPSPSFPHETNPARSEGGGESSPARTQCCCVLVTWVSAVWLDRPDLGLDWSGRGSLL